MSQCSAHFRSRFWGWAVRPEGAKKPNTTSSPGTAPVLDTVMEKVRFWVPEHDVGKDTCRAHAQFQQTRGDGDTTQGTWASDKAATVTTSYSTTHTPHQWQEHGLADSSAARR